MTAIMDDRRVERPVREARDGALPAWSTALTRLMDDFIQIPGTNIRFGFDSVIGLLFPGAGDAVSAVSGVALLVLAFTVRVPAIVIVRMAMNTIIDALLGAVPFVGDVFDFAWKSNRKNLKLIERFQRPGATARPSDYVVVGLSIIAMLLALCVPIIVVGLVIRALTR
jgi:hypothetical protein